MATDLPRLDTATQSHLIRSILPGEPYRSDSLPEPLCAYVDGTSVWVGPDNTPAGTGKLEEDAPAWDAELLESWISPGNDFRRRHGLGRLRHGNQAVPAAECVADMGLRGDRYFGIVKTTKARSPFSMPKPSQPCGRNSTARSYIVAV